MGMNEKPIWTDTHEASSDYSSKQYYGCKMTADKKVGLPTADTDVPVGIVVNNPESGKAAQVLKVGRAPGVVAETITYGQKVRIASGGKIALWEKTDTSTYCVGVCVEGATVDGDSPLGVFDFCFPGAIVTA
jgi:hypothetical protein